MFNTHQWRRPSCAHAAQATAQVAAAYPRLACLLTGAAYALAASNLFDGVPWGVVAWVALLPLHLALAGVAPWRALRYGWLAGVVAFGGTMYWVVGAMHLYGHVPVVVSVAVMVLLAAYLGLYVGLYAWGVAWLAHRRPAVVWFAAPCLWVSLEYARTYALTGLPWGLLGYSQWPWRAVIQVANVTGVYGVSFLIVLVNAALAAAMLAPREGIRRRPWLPLATAAAAVFAVCLYGLTQLQDTRPASEHLTVGIVQPNVNQAHKWDPAYRAETLDRYERLTRAVGHDADVIVWPEAATPFVFAREQAYRARVAGIVQDAQASLVFGSPTIRRRADGAPTLRNSAYVLDRAGRVTGRYDKHHLVPFGEYIPLKGLLFFLEKLVVGIGDFQPGPDPEPLDLMYDDGQHARFGAAICYEVIFPDLVRRLAGKGANFLVTLTNDAWFGDTVAPYQHFVMVVFRAVENRLSFVRAANTGVSGLIDPTGRVLAATPVFTEQTVVGAIPLGGPSTLYTQFGDVFARACVILTALLLALARVSPRADASPSPSRARPTRASTPSTSHKGVDHV